MLPKHGCSSTGLSACLKTGECYLVYIKFSLINRKPWHDYDPFGNIVSQSGAMARSNPFRFSTQYFEAQWNLYCYGYRYYIPGVGRWLSRDPIEELGGINLYAFCYNRAIGLYDRLGAQPGNPDDMPRPPGQDDNWTWDPAKDYDPRNPDQRPGNWTDPNGDRWQWDPDPRNNHGGPHWDKDKPDRDPKKRRRFRPDGSPLPDEYSIIYEYETIPVCQLPAVNPQTVTTWTIVAGVGVLLIRVLTFVLAFG